MLLKVMSIIMFICGGLTMLVGSYSLATTINAAAGTFYVASAVLILISAAMQLVASYVGLTTAGIAGSFRRCMPYGVIVIGLSLVAAFLSSMVTEAFSIASVLQGLAIPALYLIGAWFSGKQ